MFQTHGLEQLKQFKVFVGQYTVITRGNNSNVRFINNLRLCMYLARLLESQYTVKQEVDREKPPQHAN